MDALFERVYDDLRRLARRKLGRHAARPLDTTSLVHELYMKLVDQSGMDLQDRSHFLGVAGRAMRQVIVDFARRVNRRKGGGGQAHLPLDPEEQGVSADAETVLAIDEALCHLEGFDPRLPRLVELRFFAGLSEQEPRRRSAFPCAPLRGTGCAPRPCCARYWTAGRGSRGHEEKRPVARKVRRFGGGWTASSRRSSTPRSIFNPRY